MRGALLLRGAAMQRAGSFIQLTTNSNDVFREQERYAQNRLKARPTFEKRRREQLRRERKQTKAERRKLRKEESANRPDAPPGEDPDIAHIVCGPQPKAEEEPSDF